MRLLNDSREFRRVLRIEFKNPEGLRRPVDRSAGDIPAETTRVAHDLRFGQVGLAAPPGIFSPPTLAVLLLQICIEVGILQRDRGLGGEQLQYRAPGGRE